MGGPRKRPPRKGLLASMSDSYVAAVRECGAALDALEASFITNRDHLLTLGALRAASGMTADQALLSAHGLESVGVLRRAGNDWVQVAGGLQNSEGFRRGVRAALRADIAFEPVPEILALAPDGATPALRDVLLRASTDLRFGL